ncbi:hypothetical protein HU200_027760 [Digitaria exilis]|uniref:GDSL esterase/lipase n=1 Tax=Digitaria exilis TaxID=1010633 RepID=A0A835BTT9_9POAL|nr:hypothetical protein HU200_027760 [Digitaria exilis]
MKPSLCSSPQGNHVHDAITALDLYAYIACKEYFGKALFVVGWNDYGVMLVGGKSVPEVQSYVPQIVETISAATEKLINDGATSILVSGISPMGCAPGNLVFLGTKNATDYESHTGCLKALNELSKEHNAQLRRALSSLTGAHPGGVAGPVRLRRRRRRVESVLRRRRREVQLQPQRAVRDARRERL